MWEIKPPIKAKIMGCANCGTLMDTLPLDYSIVVGFGDAHVQKDDEIIYSEPLYETQEQWESECWTVQDAENETLKDPDHDWRIVLYAPLRGRTFQRQGEGNWVLIEENLGFA